MTTEVRFNQPHKATLYPVQFQGVLSIYTLTHICLYIYTHIHTCEWIYVLVIKNLCFNCYIRKPIKNSIWVMGFRKTSLCIFKESFWRIFKTLWIEPNTSRFIWSLLGNVRFGENNLNRKYPFFSAQLDLRCFKDFFSSLFS